MSRGGRLRRVEPTTTSANGIWTLNEIADYISETKWPRGPVAPTSLLAGAGNNQLSLSWTAPATTHGTITNYLIEYTPSGGSAAYVLTNSTSTSYNLTGLTNGTAYNVRVAAVNFTAGDYSEPIVTAPNPKGVDPLFSNVSLLLSMDGVNGSTEFTDSGPLGLSVSPVNGPSIRTAEAKFGWASGWFVRSSNQYLTVPASTGAFTLGTGDFTIEAWVYLSSLPSGGGYPTSFWICGWGEFNSNNGFDFYITNTNIVLNLRNFSSASVSGSHGMTTGQWYHVAATRSGASLKLFVNGVEKASATSSQEAFTPGANIAISAAEPTGATGGNWNGYIDDLRITKGVARYTSNFTPPLTAFPTSGPMSAPTTLAATALNEQISLAWAAPSYTGYSAITGYVVEYTPSGGAAFSVNTNSTSTSYNLTGLTNGTSYTIRVAAINAEGIGPYSGTVTGTLLSVSVPEFPNAALANGFLSVLRVGDNIPASEFPNAALANGFLSVLRVGDNIPASEFPNAALANGYLSTLHTDTI